MAKRIGIIGSRERVSKVDYEKVEKALFNIYEDGDWLVSGHCSSGADNFCEIIMERFGIPTLLFPARWKDWKNNWRFNKRAGFERNVWIAENSDTIIACISPDGRFEGGTGNALKSFLGMGNAVDDIIFV